MRIRVRVELPVESATGSILDSIFLRFMMLSLIFKQGFPVEIYHTPAVDVAAGALVEIGDFVAVAHAPILSGDTNGVLSAGSARYKVSAETGDVPAAISAGDKIYLDDGKLLTTAGVHVGWAPEDIPINAESFLIVVAPDGEVLGA